MISGGTEIPWDMTNRLVSGGLKHGMDADYTK